MSLLESLLRGFIPLIFLRGRKNSEVARHLRSKSYPFSSARQDAKSKKLYMLAPFRKITDGPATCSRKEIIQKISSRLYLALGVGDWKDNYLAPSSPRFPYPSPISSRRNKNKPEAV